MSKRSLAYWLTVPITWSFDKMDEGYEEIWTGRHTLSSSKRRFTLAICDLRHYSHKYVLDVDGKEVGRFNEFPSAWKKPGNHSPDGKCPRCGK